MSHADAQQAPSRHEADLAAVERVRLADFRGPTYEAFIADLYRYAWPVMLDAIRTGSIVNIHTGVARNGIPSDERQLLHDSSTEREDLALASIARAVPKFTATLRQADGIPLRAGACAASSSEPAHTRSGTSTSYGVRSAAANYERSWAKYDSHPRPACSLSALRTITSIDRL